MTPAIWTGMYCEQSLAESLRTLHACGWKVFEVSTEHLVQIETGPEGGRQIDEALAVVEELGLALPQSHGYLQADVAHSDPERSRGDAERLLRHVEISAKLGVATIVMHPGRGEGYTTREERRRLVERNLEAFRRLGDAAAASDMRIGIENMMDRRDATGGRTFGAAPHELLDFLDEAGHPALGVTIDTSHATVQHLDIPAVIRETGGLLFATHISDNDGSRDQHRSPGGGKIDWCAVISAFADIGFDGVFNLEIPGERHPDLAMRRLRTRHALEITERLLGLGESPAQGQ